ncbi:MAG: hypothetical protein AB1656_15465 [Candidatus Omnitrophota bacterium]
MRKSVFGVTMVLLIGMASAVPAQVLIPADHAAAGVKVLVPDTVFFKSTVAMGTYWEPFTDIFGDGTVAIIAGAFPEGQTTGMNAKVAFINEDGSIQEYWAFYTDAGEPYTGSFNEKRKDGNPPRIATDRRPGGTMYVVGEESTPYMYDVFNTDGRWDKSFVYTDERVAAVQAFNKTASGPQKLTNVIDPVYGSGTIEGGQNNQMRFGGEIRFLSNGNILVVVEDRNQVIVPGGNGAVATIFDSKTGGVIKGPFNAAGDGKPHSIWSNVAAFNGGFAVRTEGIMTIYDNDGNMKYYLNQAEWSTVKDTGRGDDIRIASNYTSDYVCILGSEASVGDMVVSRVNAQTGKPDKEVIVNELEIWDLGTFGRGDLAVDEYDNVCVCYQLVSSPAKGQIIARVLNSDLEPATPTFYAFQTFERGDEAELKGYEGKEVNVSMNNKRIVIAANGQTLDPTTNALTPPEHTFAIVLENPLKKDTSVDTWELY